MPEVLFVSEAEPTGFASFLLDSAPVRTVDSALPQRMRREIKIAVSLLAIASYPCRRVLFVASGNEVSSCFPLTESLGPRQLQPR
jgi:hypothetical protein